MHMQLIGDSVQFSRKLFDGGLYEEHVRQTALRRFPMNLLGYFLQRAGIRVYPDIEFLRIPAGALVHKETVSGPDVYNHSLAGRAR